MPSKLSWTDVEDLGYRLFQAHPKTDPFSVRFTDLRRLVEQLPDFEPEPDQHVNEQILEAIQCAWHEECQEGGRHDQDDDEPGYRPPVAYKPDED